MESEAGEKAIGGKRKFLKGLLWFLGTVTIGAVIYPFVRYLSPVTQAASAAGVRVAKADIPVGQAAQIAYKGEPALVIHKQEGDFIALSAVCTHLGCIVKWHPDKYEIICPCHAGTFDVNGNVISGPPPRPLPVFPITVAGDMIVVGAA